MFCNNLLLCYFPIDSSNLPALSLNVSSIVNSSAVELSWKSANISLDDSGICYDIEHNYNIEHHCISGANATIRVTCKKEELFHSFRVRANMHGMMHGEWSNSVCITFAPPSPLLFVNHTVMNSRSAKSNIGTLRLSIELQDQSAGIAGTCHNAKVRGVEIMIKRKDSEDHSHTIPENEMKYEVNFTLVQGNEENFMISAKPKSIVGDGPEQIHRFVHTTGNITHSPLFINYYYYQFFIRWRIHFNLFNHHHYHHAHHIICDSTHGQLNE